MGTVTRLSRFVPRFVRTAPTKGTLCKTRRVPKSSIALETTGVSCASSNCFETRVMGTSSTVAYTGRLDHLVRLSIGVGDPIVCDRSGVRFRTGGLTDRQNCPVRLTRVCWSGGG